MDLAGTTEAGFKLTNLRQFASVAPENQANTTKPSSLPPSLSTLCPSPFFSDLAMPGRAVANALGSLAFLIWKPRQSYDPMGLWEAFNGI